MNTERSEFKVFCDKMEVELSLILMNDELERDKCENLVAEMVMKLNDVQEKLPDPKNPATKFYRMRKTKIFKMLIIHTQQVQTHKAIEKR